MQEQILLDISKGITSLPNPFAYQGICAILTNYGLDKTIGNHLLHKAVEGWEYYSGRTVYPISHPTIADPKEAFHRSDKWQGEYGRRRQELASRIEVLAAKYSLLLALRSLDTTIQLNGICVQVERHRALLNRLMSVVVEGWEYYSGEIYYPVSHPTIANPQRAYFTEPKWQGEYGRRRQELVKRLEDILCRQLNTYNKSV